MSLILDVMKILSVFILMIWVGIIILPVYANEYQSLDNNNGSNKTYDIYFAAPLFSEGEQDFNEKVKNYIIECNLTVYLPQENNDDEKVNTQSDKLKIFDKNVQALDNSKIVIAVIDGADIDSGTAWEIGHAYGKGKPIIALVTDFRKQGDYESINLMIEESTIVVHNITSLLSELEKL